MDAEIIPLSGSVPQAEVVAQAVTALVQTRQARKLAALATLDADQLSEVARQDYFDAEERGILKFLRLFFAQESTSEHWKRTLDGLQIDAFADTAGGLVIEVNGIIVCDDRYAGREHFMSGRWLQAIVGEYRRLEMERERTARLDARRKEEVVVRALLADV